MNVLTEELRPQLFELVRSAFKTDTLARTTRYRLGWKLEDLIDVAKPFEDVVFRTLEEVESRGEVILFLRAIATERPNRADIQKFCTDHFPAALESTLPTALIQQTVGQLDAVRSALKNAQFRQSVGAFKADFQTTSQRVRLLSGYKQLHDVLHILQRQLPLIREAAQQYLNVQVARLQLRQQWFDLKRLGDRAAKSCVNLPTTPQEQKWIGEFQSAVTQGSNALAINEVGPMTAVVGDLTSCVQEAPRINSLMLMSLTDLPLDRLLAALKTIDELMTDPAADGQSIAVRSLHGAVQSLTQIRPLLLSLLAQHSTWQGLDVELANIDFSPGHKPQEKIKRWPSVKPTLVELCETFSTSEWAPPILAQIRAWESAAARADEMACDSEAASLRDQCAARFLDVDREILDVCSQLTGLILPIQALLEA